MTISSEHDGKRVRWTRLPSGLRVVTEAMPELRSVAIGFWAGTGSRDEPDSLAGPRVLAAVGPVDADVLADCLSVGSAIYE